MCKINCRFLVAPPVLVQVTPSGWGKTGGRSDHSTQRCRNYGSSALSNTNQQSLVKHPCSMQTYIRGYRRCKFVSWYIGTIICTNISFRYTSWPWWSWSETPDQILKLHSWNTYGTAAGCHIIRRKKNILRVSLLHVPFSRCQQLVWVGWEVLGLTHAVTFNLLWHKKVPQHVTYIWLQNPFWTAVRLKL